MKIAVIGGGNLGSAIVEGLISGGVCAPQDVAVSDPSPDVRRNFMTFNGSIILAGSNSDAIRGADMIVVAVKPHFMEQVLGEIAPAIDRARQTVVSTAAGVTLETLENYLDIARSGRLSVLRIITNTSVSVGEGVTLLCAGADVDSGAKERVRSAFGAAGVVWDVAEDMMAPLTALSSCGVAYALKYLEAAARGGETIGIAFGESLEIVRQTMRGALALLDRHGSRPETEIERVATKGGITRKGLDAMDAAGFGEAVESGLSASR